MTNECWSGDSSANITYGYDFAGNRTSMVNSGETTDYNYDNANRLISEIETKNSATTVTSYTYDDAGNMLRKLSTNDGKSIIYQETNNYNAFNELSSTTVNNKTTSYLYDNNGIRTEKIVDGVKTSFVLDGADVIADITNGAISTYLRGINLIARSKIGADNNPVFDLYYLYNAHGDVIQTTYANGTSAHVYKYDAFGVEQNQESSDDNPFRYCGEYFDKETGDYYLRARYYNPLIGRFTQEDTHWNTTNAIYGDNPQKINAREDKLGLKTYSYAPEISAVMQSGNLYVYCTSNPVNNLDNDGEVSKEDKKKNLIDGGSSWFNPVWRREKEKETKNSKDCKGKNDGGTIQELNGQVPTEQEARDLISEAGGNVNRVDGPHDAPNPHNYNHINYTTLVVGKGQ